MTGRWRIAFAACVLAVLVAAACSAGDCTATCVDGTVTFHLGTALSGQQMTIDVASPGATQVSAACSAGNAGLVCTPQSAGLDPHFTAQGALQSVEVPIVGLGPYRIQITVDGTLRVDKTFDYAQDLVNGVCGSSCYPSVTFETPGK